VLLLLVVDAEHGPQEEIQGIDVIVRGEVVVELQVLTVIFEVKGVQLVTGRHVDELFISPTDAVRVAHNEDGSAVGRENGVVYVKKDVADCHSCHPALFVATPSAYFRSRARASRDVETIEDIGAVA
jgi:hypothetical protein